MPFPTADSLTVNTYRNVTTLRRPNKITTIRCLSANFMIARWIVNAN